MKKYFFLAFILGSSSALNWCSSPGLAVAQSLEGAEFQKSSRPKKPNIVFIVVDDLNDWVGCLGGHPQAKTPNIDRLASEGVLFTNAHCQAPLCGPSRASFLSGFYPQTTGVYQQPGKKGLGRDDRFFAGKLLPEYFAKYGYHTLSAGKITHGYAPGKAFQVYGGKFQGFGPYPPGKKRFNYHLPNVPFSGTLTDWGEFPQRDEQLSDHKVASWAEKQLKRTYDKPFFLAVGFVRPHVPFYVPKKWFDQFPLKDIQLPKMKDDDLVDVPETGRKVHEMPKYPTLDFLKKNDHIQHKKCVQAYLACCSFVDHQVGRVLKALKKSEHATNTIVVFISDHGYHLGEKNRVSKHSLWERSTRVPFCMVDLRPKGKRVIATGSKSDQPVGLIDLYPTLTDLADLPGNSMNEGLSLARLLKNPDSVSLKREGILTVYGRGNQSIRSKNFRYIRYVDGSEEFYDHRTDSGEFINAAGLPKYQKQKKRLSGSLPSHHAPYHTSTRPNPVNRWFQQHFQQELGQNPSSLR